MPHPADREEPRYWFPAKTYGWGWGLPCAWQGWVVMGCFIGLLTGVSVAFPPGLHTAGFTVGVVGLTAAMIAICWCKGEPPRWRWGGK